jgi:hypothetical protein
MKAELKSKPTVHEQESEIESFSDAEPAYNQGEGDHTQSPSFATGSETLQSSGDETLRASSSSVSSRGSRKKVKVIKEDTTKDSSSSADNLVGKINNLITTDMWNVVQARDFLLFVLYVPLQITLSTVFLYLVLGWRCVKPIDFRLFLNSNFSAFVGLATILALSPLPGYVAKHIQTVQRERMKRVDSRVQAVTESK